jgi:tetratricopeptide (TPR) repeat protein
LGERFLFIPVLGIISVIVLGVEPYMKDKILTKLKLPLLITVLLLFGMKTIARNAEWKNNLTIYESALKVSPNSVKVHFNLGTEYLEQGLKTKGFTEKEKWFQKAVDELLDAKRCYKFYVNIYENLGFVYAEKGKIASNHADSLRNFQMGLAVLNYATDSLMLTKQSLNQNKFYLLDQLSVHAAVQKDREEYMRQIVALVGKIQSPTAEDIKRSMFYLQKLNDIMALLDNANQLIDHFPEEKIFLLQLSEQYFKENKLSQSLQILAVYVANQPQDLNAKSNLGMLHEMLGNKNEALKIYKEILAIDPNQEHTKDLYTKLVGK